MAERVLWAAKWRSQNRQDGRTEHLINVDTIPALFRTRRACREFIDRGYGYIRERPDLRAEPHGWRLPTPVRVVVVETVSRQLPREGDAK